MRTVDPIAPTLEVQFVAERFASEPNLGAIPVVESGRPLGLVTRTKLSRTLFSRFGMAVYERKPIALLLESNPLVVRAGEPVVEVLVQAVRRPPDDVYDDVIVVDDRDRYAGTAEVHRLILEQGHVLTQAVAAREFERERAEELQAMSRIRTQFLAHVTHELRAPVNTLVGLAELAEAAAANDDADRLRKVHEMIARSATSLRHLVTNVLDLTKIESGRMQPSPGPVVVEEVLIEVAESLRVLARGKPVDVRVEAPESSTRVVTDGVMLRHVLTNLGTNAVKFTDRGHVTLGVRAVAAGAVVEVIDTGCGMDPTDVERMFEPFTQAADVATRRHDGTGLGLSIVRQLVGLLGGTVHVGSRPRAGSRFAVTVPNFPNEETPT